MYDIAMIHGRFQPFHLGHFKYLKDALKISKQLYVGITNPDPTAIKHVDSDPHRDDANANPFPFYTRLLMIRQSVLCDNEIKNRINDIIIVPFPVNKPVLWKYYIPRKNIVQIMRIIDAWDLEKEKMLKENGFEIINLESKRAISGTEIRKDISEGNNNWLSKVPEGTSLILKEWMEAIIDKHD